MLYPPDPGRPEPPRRTPGYGMPPGTTPAGPGTHEGLHRPAPAAQWYDDEAGPMVRPYAMTRGRTRPAGRAFDLIALVITDVPLLADLAVGPEQAAILALCQDNPLSVAEIAAEVDLPLGVVRVLLGDLLDAEYIRVSRPVPPALLPDEHILREVINGLRAL